MLAAPVHAMDLQENQNACGEPLYVADQLIVDFSWPLDSGEPELAEVDTRFQQILAQIPRERVVEAEALNFRQLPPRRDESPSLSVLVSLTNGAAPLELSALLRQLPAVGHARPNFLYPLDGDCEDATAVVESFYARGSLVEAHALATTDRLLIRYSQDDDEDGLEEAVRRSFMEIGLAGSLTIEIIPDLGLRVQSSGIPDARAVAGLLTALEQVEWAQPDPAGPCSPGGAGEDSVSSHCGLIQDQEGQRTLVLFSSNFANEAAPVHSEAGATGPWLLWGSLPLWLLRRRRAARQKLLGELKY